MFTYKQQQLIENSGVRQIFTPGKPATGKVQFSGRENEMGHALSVLLREGEHSLVFGDRGVGKTTLINRVATQHSNLRKSVIKSHSCILNDTFHNIVGCLLTEIGINVYEVTRNQTEQRGGDTKLSLGIAKAGLKSQNQESVTLNTNITNLSINDIADKIEHLNAVLIIDEFDNLSNSNVVHEVAQLIKVLSDKGAKLKIIIAGVAENAKDLLKGHGSVNRCLKETKLDRLNDYDIAAIVSKGASKVGIKFYALAIDTISNISNGFPFFTHLIALQCLETAIANDIKSVTQMDLLVALDNVTYDARATLEHEFNSTSLSYKTNIYKNVLLATAKYKFLQFSKSQIKVSLTELYGFEYTDNALTNCLSKLISDLIFVRVKRGYYKFNDPRMPSYINLFYKDHKS